MNDPALSADDVLVAFVDLQAGIVNLGITNTPARLRAMMIVELEARRDGRA